MWHAFRILLSGVAIAYLGLCGILFALQRSLIYFPQPALGNDGATAILPTDASRVLVSTRLSDGPDALIYFGGNAEDVSFSMPSLAEAFPGFAIYALHYRGYGGSSGKPSERALFADALTLYDQARTKHSNIKVVGRSLGSGIAVYLASLRPVTRLVLVTPFDSLEGVAALHFPYVPVRWLMLDKFESWRYAPRVTAPTLIIAAEHDEIVPRASTELLQSRFKSGLTTFRIVAGAGHNSISNSAEYLPLLRGSP
jgi:pimeloyl-ACP methyl ester carboxylesterase